MKTIKCPFDFMKDQEIPLFLVFDTLSVGREEATAVARFIGWLMSCKDKNAISAAYRILEDNLDGRLLHLFITMYLKTYDKETHRVLRYHPVESEDMVRDIFYIFNTINNIAPALWQVAKNCK